MEPIWFFVGGIYLAMIILARLSFHWAKKEDPSFNAPARVRVLYSVFWPLLLIKLVRGK